jgi:predicted O-methyltransferase YrrM
MTQEQWTAVDDYIAGLFVPPDSALDGALQAAEDAKLPAIQVAPNQGKLLGILAKSIGARKILEIGTLGGYSTIWMARALPLGGKLITLEIDPKHAEVARANFVRAGVSDCVELRQGKAIDSLPQLLDEGLAPFDLIFIDADKPSNADYFAWALKLCRKGSLIIVDNVIRNGNVIDAASSDDSILGVRRFNEMAAAEPRVMVTEIQTVGSKGYDGLAIALVVSD